MNSRVEQPRLASCDYDGTQFYTSEPAPGGVDVDVAYAAGFGEHLGQTAADTYLEQGHKHRAPKEIVKGVAPHLPPDKLQVVTAKIVATKLDVLESCIGLRLEDGTPWPRPSDGFLEFWQLVDAAKAAGEPVGTAVLSNGHTRFEQSTFELWGLSQPDIYLTDDVLQALALAMPVEQQVKPAPLMINLAKTIFTHRLKSEGWIAHENSLKVVHIGDAEKDEALARNARVEFVWLKPETSRASWQQMADALHLGSLPVKETVRYHEQ